MRPNLFFAYAYVLGFALNKNTSFVSAAKGQWKLINKLFKDYEVLERPVKNDSERVLIQMRFYLRQIMDINEKNQIMRSSIWLHLLWQDDRVAWNPSDYNNVSQIIVPYTNIWVPDILLWNSATKEFDATFKTNAEIDHHGNISWVPPALFTSTCSIDITWFPFDVQACTLKFSSWTYEYGRLDLRPTEEKVDISAYQNNGEWDLEDTYCQRNVVTYECCPYDAWVDITVTIKLRRRVLYYMFNIIVPSVVISCIGLLTFALPCESGEKVTMSVTILLSLAFFMTRVSETLPSTSEAIPFLGIYFGSLMLLCATSLVITVFVDSIHHRKATISPLPKWIHKWFICRFAVFFRMVQSNHPIIACNSAFQPQDIETITSYNCRDSVSLRYRGRETSQFSTTSFVNGPPRKCHLNSYDMKAVTPITSADDRSPILPSVRWSKRFSPASQTKKLGPRGPPNRTNCQTSSMPPDHRNYKNIIKSSTLMIVEDATKILDGLRLIKTHLAERSRLEAITREWRLAASVVDRIFMYISIALFLVFNVLMTILAPNTPLSVVHIY